MFRRLIALFRGTRSDDDEQSTRADRTADMDDDDSGSGGFLRSRLDANVLYAHGQGNRQAEREITALQEEERLLEERERREE